MVSTFLSKSNQKILQQQQKELKAYKYLIRKKVTGCLPFYCRKKSISSLFSCQKHLSKNLSNHDRSQTFVSNSPNFTYLISLFIFYQLTGKKRAGQLTFISRKMGSRKFLSKLDSDKTLAVTDRSDHTGLEN